MLNSKVRDRGRSQVRNNAHVRGGNGRGRPPRTAMPYPGYHPSDLPGDHDSDDGVDVEASEVAPVESSEMDFGELDFADADGIDANATDVGDLDVEASEAAFGGSDIAEPAVGNSAASPLIIEREPSDKIVVGAGGKLVVPREDIGDDIDIGEELDLIALQGKKIRKPGRREWFVLDPASELTTKLLLHKPKADGVETEYFYVDKRLRGPIRDELKDVRVFVYYSFTTHSHALWIVHVTVGNSWYESLQPLFGQPPAFFKNAIRVMSDKPNSRYRVRFKPTSESVVWPSKPTEELLGDALGPDRFITSADHPLYRDLIDGSELR